MSGDHELRVLIVGGDERERVLIRRAIATSALAATVLEAHDGATALAVAAGQACDCVLIGPRVPDRSIDELVRSLRSRVAAAPILVVLGPNDAARAQALIDAGATDCLPADELAPGELPRRLRLGLRVAEAEAGARRARAAALAATRARDAMLSIVSHDLRGPLNAIGLACGGLTEELTSGDAKRYLGAIERASQRAERLIRDLLEVTRLEGAPLQIERASVDARALVQHACAAHAEAAGKAGSTLAAVVPEHEVRVLADRDRILQVLGNLIGNALSHARGAAIEVSLEVRPGAIAIAVQDHGPGIPADHVPHVFDRHWPGRTHRSGPGLGLAIAKGIVDAHRGELTVTSEPGQGARFELTLPRA